jgi:FkbM family methyltransferase
MLKRIYRLLTLRDFRAQLLDNDAEVIKNLELIRQQNMLLNPAIVVKNVVFKLPLFNVDHIQKIIYRTQDYYEIETLGFLKRYLKDVKNVIDIGSNIGNHVLFYLSEMSVDKVICFEPNNYSYQLLIENLAINKFTYRTMTENVALGEKQGVGFESGFTTSNTGMNKITHVKSSEFNNGVKIRRLDDYNFENIDFIKIDVEGFELEVLNGAQETIKCSRPTILIEVFDENASVVKNYFKSLNYSLLVILEDYNYVFIPNILKCKEPHI